MTRLRQATVDDLDGLVTLGAELLSTHQPDFSRDPGQQVALLRQLLTGGDDMVVWVADDVGTLVAMLGLVVYPHFVSGERVAVEMFWYARPTAPRGVGVRLLQKGEQWAQKRRATAIHMMALASNPRVETVYQRLGFSLLETTWTKRFSPRSASSS